MNRGRGQNTAPAGGYTIVETLIFLAVSAAMFVAAMLLIAGQQSRAEFVNVVRDFETRLVDISNDISTGYYQSTPGLLCHDTSSGPDFTSGAGELGAHKGCMFIGKVIKFGSIIDGDKSKYAVLGMAGNTTTTVGGSIPVASLGQSLPRVIQNASAYELVSFGHGATIEKVTYNNGSDANAHAIGFFTTFQGSSLRKDSGSRQTTILPYPSVVFSDQSTTTVNKLNNISASVTGTNYDSLSLMNPSGGVTICIKSGGIKQYALVKLGVAGSNNSTVISEIKSYTSDANICL